MLIKNETLRKEIEKLASRYKKNEDRLALFLAYRYLSDRGDVIYITTRKIKKFYKVNCEMKVFLPFCEILRCLQELKIKEFKIDKRTKKERLYIIVKRRPLRNSQRVRRFCEALKKALEEGETAGKRLNIEFPQYILGK